MIRAIFFDLGETLIHFGRVDPYECFKRGAVAAYAYLQARGLRLPSFRQYHQKQWRAIRRSYLWSHVRGREVDALALLRRVCKRMGICLDGGDLLPLADCFYQPLRQNARVDPQAHEVLAACQQRGLRLGIISNTMVPAAMMDDHLRREGLLDYFAARVYSCEVRVRKPARAIFRLALERLGVSARQCVYVGDSVNTDVIGANRAGMVSVWRRTRPRARRWFAAPDFVISSLRELSAVLDELQSHTGPVGP